MQERREHAETAWREARECVLASSSAPASSRAEVLRQCSGTARSAAELTLELPEHNSEQLEVRAALDELVGAIESGNEHQLSSAVERSARAGSALGWRVVHTGLH